ncbi:MAG: rhamnan synthesis F family protein, partial [Candidatus Aenigmatarchaeota archaeon]
FDNPKGFFENEKITFFNEFKLLPSLKTSWDDLRPIPLSEILSVDEKLKEEAYSILEADYREDLIFGIKDPRMCIVFPFWEELLLKFGAKMKVIVLYRNPLEVAYSLNHRNNFPLGKGFLLWAKYTFFAEYYSRKYDRVFVTYNKLIDNPLEELERICRRLKIPLNEIKLTEIRSFVEKPLKNFHFTLKHLPNNTPSFIRDSALWLEKLSLQEIEEDESIKERFDYWRCKYIKEYGEYVEEFVGSKNLKVQLFIDDGKGFREEQSFTKEILPKKLQEIIFEIPSLYTRSLRFDPLNIPCACKIKKFILVDEAGNESELTSFNTNGVVLNCKILFPHSDPSVLYPNIDKRIRQVRVILEYESILDSILEISNLLTEKESELARLNEELIRKDLEGKKLVEKMEEEIEKLNEALSNKEKEIEELSSKLEEKDLALKKNSEEVENLRSVLKSKESELAKLNEELIRKDAELQSIKSSFTWRSVMKWHSFIERIAPLGTKRRRWYDLGVLGLRVLASEGFRGLWRKYRIYKNLKKIRKRNQVSSLFKTKCSFVPFTSAAQLKCSKKIGVHVHLFYEDLLEEILKYLSNLKYQFSLYITCPKDKKDILSKYYIKERLKFANEIEIIPVENRGRNFAPLLISLRKKLKDCDYILHIHTKKSLYTGSEQEGWRKHLLDHLIGSEEIVNNIINLLEKTKVGFIAPKTYPGLPYWAHDWLSNKIACKNLSERIGIPLDSSKYADFSVGSMFWCKRDAIRQLFDADFDIYEFPEEPIPPDGTICHAIERCFGEVVRYNGYEFAEIDIENKKFIIGKSSKNLYQYWSKSIRDLKMFVESYKVISFDIFDTIVTRALMDPDDLFKIIDSILPIDVKKKIGNFFKLRKSIEYELRESKGKGKDVNIYEIYDKMAKIAKLDESEMAELLNLELRLEKALIRPRKEICELLNDLIKRGKEIVLSSDMYLTAEQIKYLLDNFINIHSKNIRINVSSETGFRKDRNGEYFDVVRGHIQAHVGDNEYSDIQMCVDRKIPCFHVMSPKRLLELCENINDYPQYTAPVDSILLGLSTVKLFSNPFALNSTGGLVYFDKCEDFGY